MKKSKLVDELIEKIAETTPLKGEKIIPKKFDKHEILTEELKQLTDSNIITACKFTD